MERYIYQINQPTGKMSLANMRNTLRALHSCDFNPFQPRAYFDLEDGEYGTNAQAQTDWSAIVSGTIKSNTTSYAGNYSLEVSDCGIDEAITRTRNVDISAYGEIKLWMYQDEPFSAINFFALDSQAQRASWDITGSADLQDAWKSDILDVTTPDLGAVDLSDITSYGFSNLVSDTQYLFDAVKARVGLAVAVESASVGSYYENIYRGGSRVTFAGGASPALVAPLANPRIDLLYYTSDLSWVNGVEAASPVEPVVDSSVIPICFVYSKPTMTRVVAYEDKDIETNEGYIYKDIRPLYNQLETVVEETVVEDKHSPIGSIYLGATQVDIPNLVWTTVQLNAKRSEFIDGIEDTVNYKITPGVAGFYLILGAVEWTNLVADKEYRLRLWLNDAVVVQNTKNVAPTTAPLSQKIHVIYKLSNTDFLRLFVYHNSGVSTEDLQVGSAATFLSVSRIG